MHLLQKERETERRRKQGLAEKNLAVSTKKCKTMMGKKGLKIRTEYFYISI